MNAAEGQRPGGERRVALAHVGYIEATGPGALAGRPKAVGQRGQIEGMRRHDSVASPAPADRVLARREAAAGWRRCQP